MGLFPWIKKVHGKYARFEYGFIGGDSTECRMATDSSRSGKLHYYVQREKEKIRVNFFCIDEEK